jgi:hypothetical protein
MNKRKVVIASTLLLALLLIWVLPDTVRALKLGNGTRETIVESEKDLSADEVQGDNFRPIVSYNPKKAYRARYVIRKTYYRSGLSLKVRRDTVTTQVISRDAG